MYLETETLDNEGLRHFKTLGIEAIDNLVELFYKANRSAYESYGERGIEFCSEDLDFHIEFLRPVLEFGITLPMVDYLRWLASVLVKRDITANDLALSLDWLAEFFSNHMVENEAKIVVNALALIKTQFQQAVHDPSAIHQIVPEPWLESEAFELALLAGNRKEAEAIFDNCLTQGRSLVDVELHLIQYALYGIGEKWQNNQVSVAQEHIATAISQSLMNRGLLFSQVPTAIGRRILLACVQDNIHAVGLQMVADAFQLAGWEVQYLGANVPTDALLLQVEQYKPDLLGLSVAFAHQFSVVKEIISRLKQVHGDGHPPVIVGGLAINQFDALARVLGASAHSPDACSAVVSATRIVKSVTIP